MTVGTWVKRSLLDCSVGESVSVASLPAPATIGVELPITIDNQNNARSPNHCGKGALVFSGRNNGLMLKLADNKKMIGSH